ncbi:hypothetical protein SBY92_002684 [Candida maltosa Xu316]|uniref:Uncharacterized protein n=1 Tax=Candida maltosa (strain Xu316) TaxID=1245528 RepID=M3IJH7_CANMX|nr:hypothetical protein G210_3219 [Candida maltosa Xu316]
MSSNKELNRTKAFLNYTKQYNDRIKALEKAEEFFRQSSMIEAINIPIEEHASFFDSKIQEFSDKVDRIDREFLNKLKLNPQLGIPESMMNLSVFKQELRREFMSKKMDLFDEIYQIVDTMIEKHHEIKKNYEVEVQNIEKDFIGGNIDEIEYINRVLGDF